MVEITTNPNKNKVVYWHPKGSGFNDSADNPYLETINDLFCLHGTSGAYSVDWSTVSLPDDPPDFRVVVRKNTDDSNKVRLYCYDGSAWKYLEFT